MGVNRVSSKRASRRAPLSEIGSIDDIIVIARSMVARFSERAPEILLGWALTHNEDDEIESGHMWREIELAAREILRRKELH